jgi:hypothetical protein
LVGHHFYVLIFGNYMLKQKSVHLPMAYCAHVFIYIAEKQVF